MHYASGFGFPVDVLFDVARMRQLFENKWFFVGTRGDVPQPRDYFTFALFNNEYALVHGSDGEIRCFVNRCAHQSARLLLSDTGACAASLVCPNHQWTYELDSGRLKRASGFDRDFADTELGKASSLTSIPVQEVSGMLFACLGADSSLADIEHMREIAAPYTDPFAFDSGGYKLAHHHREIVPANWLLVMINNRECCHCRVNHRGLTTMFDPSSFNGATSPAYDALLNAATERWDDLGLQWQEQAFEPNDCMRIARYPLRDGYQSITFDGRPASQKLIGPFAEHESGTLSMWFNPNAWVHFTSDHIATNWVLPIDGERSMLYSSWIVHEDAVEGDDYEVDHLTDVWRVTNSEDVDLCNSMTIGAQSDHYRPGPFSNDERFCTQFCDWYMTHSA